MSEDPGLSQKGLTACPADPDKASDPAWGSQSQWGRGSTTDSHQKFRTPLTRLSGPLKQQGKGRCKLSLTWLINLLLRNDDLIQNCIKEAEKHASEIAELENRTALHIEYAQEKQIEIQNLEVIIDTYKNKSRNFLSTKKEYEKNLTTLEAEIISKDTLINKLKDDIEKLEQSFSKEEMKKHQEIESLNKRIENALVELANDKITINQLENANQDRIDSLERRLDEKDEEIKEGLKRLDKYKQEKLNLLKIVQQLADLGNPALTFTATIDDLDYYDQLQEQQEQEASASCCEDTQEFVNYDVNEAPSNEVLERVDYDDYEGSTSNENFSDSLETSQEEDSDLL